MQTIPILIPTRDYKTVGQTLMNLIVATLTTETIPDVCFSYESTLFGARTKLLSGFNQRYPKGTRGFMIDSDIMVLNTAEELSSIISFADRNGYNIVGNYRKADGANVIKLTDDHTMTMEEYDKLDNYSEITSNVCGLGFYYGYIPPNYEFHADAHVGEDVYFFRENELHPRLCKTLKLGHMKEVLI